MRVTIYFYKYPDSDNLNEWDFFHNEFNMGKISDFIAEVYKHNNGAIVKEINIKRI